MTAELTDPARIRRLEITVYGDKTAEPVRQGVVDILNQHTRVLFGSDQEEQPGLIANHSELRKAVEGVIKQVGEMSDGKKMLLTLAGLGITALGSFGSLVVSLATAYVVLTRGVVP